MRVSRAARGDRGRELRDPRSVSVALGAGKSQQRRRKKPSELRLRGQIQAMSNYLLAAKVLESSGRHPEALASILDATPFGIQWNKMPQEIILQKIILSRFPQSLLSQCVAESGPCYSYTFVFCVKVCVQCFQTCLYI